MSIATQVDSFLDHFIGNPNTSVERDLVLNFKKLLEESALDITERLLSLMALATALNNQALTEFARSTLLESGATEEQITEARQCAAIMGMLNTYYKFKSYLDTTTAESYVRAGLRMNSLSKPVNGKERFEQMAFAVSVLNGCPTCVVSHEKALSDLGTSKDKIHDLARLAAVTKGIVTLKH